jgi:hypothetical protein
LEQPALATPCPAGIATPSARNDTPQENPKQVQKLNKKNQNYYSKSKNILHLCILTFSGIATLRSQ